MEMIENLFSFLPSEVLNANREGPQESQTVIRHRLVVTH